MSTKARYRLAAEYDCYPTWIKVPGGGLDNPSPFAMGLPDKLAANVERWGAIFDSTLDREDPMSSGFATTLESELFSAWGYSLASLIVAVLDEPIEYFDNFLQTYTTIE